MLVPLQENKENGNNSTKRVISTPSRRCTPSHKTRGLSNAQQGNLTLRGGYTKRMSPCYTTRISHNHAKAKNLFSFLFFTQPLHLVAVHQDSIFSTNF